MLINKISDVTTERSKLLQHYFYEVDKSMKTRKHQVQSSIKRKLSLDDIAGNNRNSKLGFSMQSSKKKRLFVDDTEDDKHKGMLGFI